MKFLIALAICLGLAGCPLTKPDSAESQVAKIAVQYATAKFIAKAPEGQQSTRAGKITAIVSDIEALAKGESVTLEFLEEAIRRNIPRDLAPEDLVAVNALTGLVLSELRARVTDGVLKPEQVVVVSAVASWIVETAEYYRT